MRPNIIQIPLSEYQHLKDELKLLKNSKLLIKFNKLIVLLYEDKYGFYMHDFTDDLTEYSINNNWKNETSRWDNI
ncbi:MAG: hypothetical protein WC868_00475 [Bacteroidales bacterium]